jgi:hypothetical protein
MLQVGVYTWPYEWPYFDVKTNSQELKQRWIKYGDLAIGLAYSDFAPLTLPRSCCITPIRPNGINELARLCNML